MKKIKKKYTGLMWEQKPPKSILNLAISKHLQKNVITAKIEDKKPSAVINDWTIKLR